MKLKDYLKYMGYTQKDLSKKIGWKDTQGYISLISNMKKMPTFYMAKKIIDATHGMVTLQDLYFELFEFENKIIAERKEMRDKILRLHKMKEEII